ncbi:MAG TPA: UDP-2,3-diacylglucosamine diphosphatase LpxI [Phycisphaerae bacterium]|nr:UDP-2,3-diacylglucosamine diphosphatase LpxI [Phycisphaerae bacterium]
MPHEREPIGLIAGAGRPPFLVAAGMRAAGRKVVVAGLRGFASPRLGALADEFVWVGVARLGRWIAALKRRGVREAVMIGQVAKGQMHSPLRLLRFVPDLRTAWLFYVRIRKDKRDNKMLLAAAEELHTEGIELVSSVKYCQEHLADEGLMTRARPASGVAADVEFGWRIARASADLDIGQSVAVKERDILAVEAVEGTDEMIRRAGQLCRKGKWTLIKVARPDQDMRFDVPVIGPETVRSCHQAGCACIVVEAGKVLVLDKPTALALANRLGIAVVGKRPVDRTAQDASGAPGDPSTRTRA